MDSNKEVPVMSSPFSPPHPNIISITVSQPTTPNPKSFQRGKETKVANVTPTKFAELLFWDSK